MYDLQSLIIPDQNQWKSLDSGGKDSLVTCATCWSYGDQKPHDSNCFEQSKTVVDFPAEQNHCSFIVKTPSGAETETPTIKQFVCVSSAVLSSSDTTVCGSMGVDSSYNICMDTGECGWVITFMFAPAHVLFDLIHSAQKDPVATNPNNCYQLW